MARRGLAALPAGADRWIGKKSSRVVIDTPDQALRPQVGPWCGPGVLDGRSILGASTRCQCARNRPGGRRFRASFLAPPCPLRPRRRQRPLDVDGGAALAPPHYRYFLYSFCSMCSRKIFTHRGTAGRASSGYRAACHRDVATRAEPQGVSPRITTRTIRGPYPRLGRRTVGSLLAFSGQRGRREVGFGPGLHEVIGSIRLV